MTRAHLLFAAVSFAWLGVGCRSGGGELAQPVPHVTPMDSHAPAQPPIDDEPPTPRPKASVDTTDTSTFEGTAGATHEPRPDAKMATLRNVRAAQHENFDRVVFEFDGDARPGYHVEYVDKPVRQCGSGDIVEIAGHAWLSVRITPAAAHDEAGKPTIPFRERKLKLDMLEEMVRTCDFEGEVTWVLGVSSRNRYRVLELTKPARLVVDVKR